MRKNLIPQYIDNTFNYGLMVNYANATTEEIAELDVLNNKGFYLDVENQRKKAIICDAEWLSTYVITEHLYLLELLQDVYNFQIINCKRLDVTNLDIVADLNRYDVLLVAYHVYARIPLHLVSAYKIFKIDDLENDPSYTELVRYYIKNSDMVISPYAYVFSKYYHHDNVQWVPYSCALEGLSDFPKLGFNINPIMKVLQSGHVNASYPFRQYVAALDHENVERLPHQGWRHDSTSEAVVRIRYYEKLNEYICCFTDALSYRYIVLKNFEIAAVGSLLLTDRVIEKEMNQLGFVDYETCIFCDQETFLAKVSWILDNSNREKVDQIRRRGMDLVRQHHMTRHRALQIDNLVNDRERVR
jgi:Glycosyl transferases group 1